MLAQIKAKTEAETLRANPALVQARRRWRSMASAWLVTVSMVVRKVRKPARSAAVLGVMVVLRRGNEADAGIMQDARLVGGAMIRLVGVDPGVGWQAREEFMDGGKVVVAGREQRRGDGHAVGGADQMQAPAEERFLAAQ